MENINLNIVKGTLNKLSVLLDTQIEKYTAAKKPTNVDFERIHKTLSIYESVVDIYGNLIGIDKMGKEEL
jgi:hypothetical protein